MSTFGYHLNMSYFESQAEGVMNPESRYSVVGVKIEMTSIYLKFLLLYYLPSYMITISSWFFYLLPSTSYPARTALLMTAFLLLIQIYNSVVNDTPSSNDVTYLETFVLACVVTVFGTLMTYAIILTRDQLVIQGLILNDEGEEEEDNNINVLKKPKSAWSDSQLFVKKSTPTTRKHVILEFSMFLIVFSGFAGFNMF